MWCLTSRESLEVLAADNVGRQSGREEATSIRIIDYLVELFNDFALKIFLKKLQDYYMQ